MKQFYIYFPILQALTAKSGNSIWQTVSAKSKDTKLQAVSAQSEPSKVQSVIAKLSWTHFVRLLSVSNEDERNFYLIEYTLPANNKQIFAKEYRLYLPQKEDLKKLLSKFL